MNDAADGHHGPGDEATWKRRLDDGAREMGVKLDESLLDTLWRYGYLLRERNQPV